MKHDRKKDTRMLFLLAELVLGIAAAGMLAVMFSGEKETPKAAVIVSQSDSGQWSAFVAGIKQAASDRNIDVVISSTGWLTVEEERALMQQEMDSGADALIVQPAPGTGTERMLRETAGNVPVMLVGAGTAAGDAAPSFPVMMADNYAMGEALAGMIREDFAGKLDGRTVGLVSRTPDAADAADRERGFLDGMKGTGCTVQWTLRGTDEDKTEAIYTENRVDLVAALNTGDLEAAGTDAEARRIHGALVYGIASSTKALYFLDHDNVEGLVFPNGFELGYRSFAEVAEKLEHGSYRMQSGDVSFRTLRREDLFSGEDEVLFMPQ